AVPNLIHPDGHRYPHEYTERDNMERDRLLRAFAGHWRTLGYAEMTLDNYVRCIRRLPDPLDAVTPLDLPEALQARRSEVGPAAPASEVRAYRTLYGWLSEALDKPNPGGT
ncbi:MAG TPA: hypothetical protein VKD67_09295, partial [Acidimicrobiales bacterium]|nr:hypothetical protein [Acidimicrobiales bacterium]